MQTTTKTGPEYKDALIVRCTHSFGPMGRLKILFGGPLVTSTRTPFADEIGRTGPSETEGVIENPQWVQFLRRAVGLDRPVMLVSRGDEPQR